MYFTNLALISALLLPSFTNANVLPAMKDIPCPDKALGEKPEDCPWAKVAHQIADPASSVTLKHALPDLYNQIVQDAKAKKLQDLWGDSINYDELTKSEIVAPRILNELNQILQLDASKTTRVTAQGHQVVHAGMEHTYGYVLSTLQTAYGFKRARWVQNEIEHGFGLPEGSLSPSPKKGTLFSNVSQFIGRVALRDSHMALTHLNHDTAKVPDEILKYPYSSLQITRLVEETSFGIVLRTDFITFPHPQNNTSLLIYSVFDPSISEIPRIISAFPVKDTFVQQALKDENLGENKIIVTRYNAYIAAITDSKQPIFGHRSVLQAQPTHLTQPIE